MKLNAELLEGKGRTEKEILDELDDDIKGIKINAELFKEEDHLDELNNIEEDEAQEKK